MDCVAYRLALAPVLSLLSEVRVFFPKAPSLFQPLVGDLEMRNVDSQCVRPWSGNTGMSFRQRLANV